MGDGHGGMPGGEPGTDPELVDRQAIAEARRMLGRQLAERRRAAGYSQHRLAPLTLYARSTVANVEVGRQNVPREFWERCDDLLAAGGALIRGYEHLHELIRRHHADAARALAEMPSLPASTAAEVRHGRRVVFYDLRVRIADCAGNAQELLAISSDAAEGDGAYGGDVGAYGGDVTVAESPEGVSANMLRRHLLALGATVSVGAPIKGWGELLGLDAPPPVPLPSRLFEVHVVQVRELTRDLREAILAHGSQPQVSSAVAAWADQLLGVPGPDAVIRELRGAVAELHTLAAGWAGLDAGLYSRALYHYSRGCELASDPGTAYLQAIALACAGLTMLEQDHPRDALNMLRFAHLTAWRIPGEYDRRMVQSCAQADSVIALLGIGDVRAALIELAKSRELWQPHRSDPRGDQDYVAARLEMGRGRLDAAEPFAAASVARWDGISELRRTQSAVVLATIHVRAEETDALPMAHRAITDVTRLSSAQARTRLHPLAAALEARRDGDAQQLARRARQVAAVRS